MTLKFKNEDEWKDWAKKNNRNPITGNKINPTEEPKQKQKSTTNSEKNRRYVDKKRDREEKRRAEFERKQLEYQEFLKEKEIERRNVEIIQRKEEREREAKREKEVSDYKKKMERKAEQRDFNKHIGNYQARDYFTHVSSWSASAVIRKPFNRSGLRNEFVSRGYTGRSGLPEMDNNWDDTTGSTVKGRVKGNLSIGEGSRKRTNKLTPSIVPNLGYLLNNPVGSGIGSGNVIMPIAVMKWKKRGGKHQRGEFWL